MKTHERFMRTLVIICGYLVIMQGINGCNNSGDNAAETETRSGKKEVSAPDLDIHAAALLGDLNTIQQHIAAGTDLEQKDPIGGATPLITACVFGKTDVARVLIDSGVNLDAKNNDGSTPLHCAALFGYPDIVKYLLEHGADKTLENNTGNIPIAAVAGPFEEMVPVYEILNKQLGPLGLKLDFDELRSKRPEIAALLN